MNKNDVVTIATLGLTLQADVTQISNLPAWEKPLFIEGTAERIAALKIMEPVFPIFIPADGKHSIQSQINDLEQGLEALGVTDSNAEVAKALARIKERVNVNSVKQAILHLGGI